MAIASAAVNTIGDGQIQITIWFKSQFEELLLFSL